MRDLFDFNSDSKNCLLKKSSGQSCSIGEQELSEKNECTNDD